MIYLLRTCSEGTGSELLKIYLRLISYVLWVREQQPHSNWIEFSKESNDPNLPKVQSALFTL